MKTTCLFRPHSFLTATPVVVVATLLQGTAPSALAAGPYYWDCNDGDPGFGTAQGSFAGTTIPTATYGWSTNATGSTAISGGAGVNPGTASNVFFGTATYGLETGTITVSGTQNIGDITFGAASGAIILGGNGPLIQGSAGTITVNNSLDTINSVVKGAGNELTIAGSGTLVLNGLNTFTGKLTIGNNANNTLKLQFNTIGNVGAVTGSSLGQPADADKGLIQIGANSKTSTLEFTGASAAGSTDRQVQVGGPSGVGGATILNNNADSAYSLTFANAAFNVPVAAPLARSLTLGGINTGNNQIEGVIADNSGTGKILGVVKSGSGTWILSGANTYTGNTTVSAGTLQLGAAGVLPDGSGKGNVSVTGTLDLNTYSETINGLSGAGVVDTVAGGTPTLAVGGNDQTSTFSGVIKNTAGTLALSKTGTGALTLSGPNTYTGATLISGGTLLVNGNQSTATGAVTVDATLGGAGTIGGATTVNGNLAPGASSVGKLTFTGGLTLGSLAANSLKFELGANSAAGTTYDTVDTTTLNIGTLDFADFQFTDTGALAAGAYTLISSGALPTGSIGTASGNIGAFSATLSISGNNIILTVTASGSPYTTWAGGAAFDADANGDGVDNGLAWILGAANPGDNALGLLPISGEGSDNLTMTFTQVAPMAPAKLFVEYSNDLGVSDPWHSVQVPDTVGTTTVSDVIFTITGTTPTQSVSLSVPVSKAGAGRLFGRLRGSEN